MNYIGLSAKEIPLYQQKYGQNILPAPNKITKMNLFLHQFASPIVIVLVIAAIITLILQDYLDFCAIAAVILINALLGFIQENKAHDALTSLQSIIKPQVTVVRDSIEQMINAEDLVPGDIVKLKQGNKIPADGIILHASKLIVNEAALTGESRPINKSAYHLNTISELSFSKVPEVHKLFMGTVVTGGYTFMKVVQTGTSTEFGQIALSLAEEAEPATPLQLRLNEFSRQISLIVALIAVFIFIIGIIHNQDFANILNTSASLAVSAIPEGLVISLTVILTLGMQKLLHQKALVRKLIVAETLGSVTTICVDKTGTLTEGNMKIIGTVFTDDKIARKALLACSKDLNSVDTAISEWLGDSQDNPGDIFKNDELLDELPFNSLRKYALSLHENNMYIVGAPDVLLKNALISQTKKQEWLHKIEYESAHGRRIVGVGYRTHHHTLIGIDETKPDKYLQELTWLGYVIIEDPIRHDAKEAFTSFRIAGVDIKVITGDHRLTAVYIMQELGIDISANEMMSGEELESVDETSFAARIKHVKLFYRTSPHQKLKIVQALQSLGEVVGMMGDGINDAPALHKANVGIVLDNATDVSKETADMILLDSNLNTIKSAIIEGRAIFDTMRKVIAYLLTNSTAELILVSGSLLLNLPMPLLPVHILFINLISDGLPAISLAFEPTDPDMLAIKPLKKATPLVDMKVTWLVLIIGIISNILLFFLYDYLLETGMGMSEIRSFLFTLIAISSVILIYPIRSLRKNIWQVSLFSNQRLNIAVISSMISLALAFTIVPIKEALSLSNISPAMLLIILIICGTEVIMIEFIKACYFQYHNSAKIVTTRGLQPSSNKL